MNSEVCSCYTLACLKLRYHGKCRSRIDQGSDCAAVHHALVLFEFIANFNPNAGLAVSYLAEFEAEKLCVRD